MNYKERLWNVLQNIHTKSGVSYKFIADDAGIDYHIMRNFIHYHSCGKQSLSKLITWVNVVYNIDVKEYDYYE